MSDIVIFRGWLIPGGLQKMTGIVNLKDPLAAERLMSMSPGSRICSKMISTGMKKYAAIFAIRRAFGSSSPARIFSIFAGFTEIARARVIPLHALHILCELLDLL